MVMGALVELVAAPTLEASQETSTNDDETNLCASCLLEFKTLGFYFLKSFPLAGVTNHMHGILQSVSTSCVILPNF